MASERGIRARIGRVLFGDDIFISYSHNDGLEYAEELEKALFELGFDCGFDPISSYANSPEEGLPAALRRQLLRSSMLVVVATPAAVESRFVAQEVNEYIRHHITQGATLRAIAFDDSVSKASWKELVEGFVLDGGELQQTPTPHVLEQITRSARFTTRRRRVRALAMSSVALLCFVTALGAAVSEMFSQRAGAAMTLASSADAHARSANESAIQAEKHARQSDEQARESDRQARDAQVKVEEAHKKVVELEGRAEQAEQSLNEAHRATDAAQVARDRALHQRQALELAAESRVVLVRDPKAALMLALHALDRSSAPEIVQSLREALIEFTPSVVFTRDAQHPMDSCASRDGSTVFAIDQGHNTFQIWDADHRVLRKPERSLESGIWKLECGPMSALLMRYEGPTYLVSVSAPTLRVLEDPPGQPAPPVTFGASGFAPDGGAAFTLAGDTYRVWNGQGSLLYKGTVVLPAQLALVSVHRLVVIGDSSLSLLDRGRPTAPAAAAPYAARYLGALGHSTAILLRESEQDPQRKGVRQFASARKLPTFERIRDYKDALDEGMVTNRSGTLVATRVPNTRGSDSVFIRASLVDPALELRARNWRWSTDHTLSASGLAFFPPPFDEQAFLTWEDGGSNAQVWDPTTGLVLRRLSVPGEVLRAAWIADGGRRLFATIDSGAIRSWELFPSGVPTVRVLTPPDWDWSNAFSVVAGLIAPNGHDAAAAVWDLRGSVKLYLFRAEEKRPRLLWAGPFPGSSFRYPMAFSEDSRQFVASDPTGAMHVDGEADVRCLDPTVSIESLAIANDGTIARAVYRQAAPARTLVEVMAPSCDSSPLPLNSSELGWPVLAFTASDSILVIESETDANAHSGSVRRTLLWNLHAGAPLADPFIGAISAVSRDGSQVITAETRRGPLALSKRQLQGWVKTKIDGFTGEIEQMAWNGDGQFVLTRSADDVVRVWDVQLGNLAWSLPVPDSQNGVNLKAAVFRAPRSVVSLWSQGSLRTDPCDVCRPVQELIDLAHERSR